MHPPVRSSSAGISAAAECVEPQSAPVQRPARPQSGSVSPPTGVKTVFIVGPPRSGTTLLSYLLAGGKGALSLSEPFLAHTIYPHWRLRWFFARIRKAGGLRKVPVPRNSDHDRFMQFLSELAKTNGLPYLVIKETYRLGREWANTELMDRVTSGPYATVPITRHPYDAAVSTLRFCRWWRGIPGRLARCWVHGLPLFADDTHLMQYFAENWRAFVDWAQRSRLNIVRYEDLVSKPQESLPALCYDCGLPYQEQMLDHSYRRTAFGGLGAPEVMNRPPKPVNTRSVGRAKQLPAQHRDLIKAVCGEAAAALDYPM